MDVLGWHPAYNCAVKLARLQNPVVQAYGEGRKIKVRGE